MPPKKENPRAANRGVTKTTESNATNIRKSVSLDFLTCKLYRKSDNILKLLPDWKCLQIVEKIAPRYRYPQVYLLRCGGTLAIGYNERQGIMLDMSGSELRECRKDDYYSDELMLAYILENGSKISRMDIAIDVISDDPHPCQPLEFRKLYKAGKLKTRMQLNATYKDEKVSDYEGYSVYFGSESSDQIMCIYDKKSEQRLESLLQWTRLELRLKDAYAWVVAKVIAQEGITAAASSKFNKVFEVQTEWYKQIMNAPQVEIPEVKRKESQYERWLMTSVLPSLIDHLSTHPVLVRQFFNELSEAITVRHTENGLMLDY